MPIWILQLVLGLVPLFSKLIDKYVPNNISKKREFKTKRKVVNAMNKFNGKTLEQIRQYGIKKGVV